MQYLCFTFTLTPASEAAYDLLADALAGAGFDSFVHTDE
ncbi:MAG: 50S ribosomal protein L11 methyltransferase, partial [Prevotellaceae bacterium]|nr:50S ribosomal protein L11 methyltransferase [Prevotellaceae bacterium]